MLIPVALYLRSKLWIDKQRLIRKGPLDAFTLIHDPARTRHRIGKFVEDFVGRREGITNLALIGSYCALDSFFGRFVGSNTDGFFDRINKNFTVADFPGFSCIDHS
jgi:hypothetical protein